MAGPRKKPEPQEEPERIQNTTILFPKSVHRRIRVAALLEGISMSAWVARACEKELEEVEG